MKYKNKKKSTQRHSYVVGRGDRDYSTVEGIMR